MAKRKKRDITILMGDMNAKVGSANSGNEGVMGKHGVGTMNHNGELFVDFCSVNDMIIGGTLFPHKESHKVTWRSPDGSWENQIDHIAISRRWRGTLQDCRIKRSADVGSDHHLLLASYEEDDNEGEDEIETEWSIIKEAYTSTCEEVLGKVKRERKEWMSDDTWEKVEERRKLKANIDNCRTRNQKANAMKQTSLWNILAHYGIPSKIISMIKVFYNNFQAQVSHEGDLTEPFNMTTGVRQECLLSPLLFITALDWVMRETTKDGRTGIQWTLTDMLDDLDFADDLALLCHTISQMREKTQRLERNSGQVGLRINPSKTKEMRVKTVGNAKPVCCRGIELETVKEFTYLGSVISSDGGATKDVEARIGKGNAAFVQLRPVWRARNISLRTKLRIFESNFKSILLYGCETWGLRQANMKKLQTFINVRLRYILGIWWPNKISKNDLLERTGQEPVEVTIRRRKWRWIGHTLRKPPPSITRAVLEWNPQGKRRRGRPRLSWRRGVMKDLQHAKTSWQEAKTTAKDRGRWRHLTEALCSRRGKED
ncbi:uncharacterized protein LOC144885281 [Branchiostoma floridae x Branchiostoma japonicum]